jgi:hypothetical protein
VKRPSRNRFGSETVKKIITVMNGRGLVAFFFFKLRPWEYFAHVSIITPVVSALKNYSIKSFLGVPADIDILSRFWIQVAVSEVKWPLHMSTHNHI